MKKIQSRTKFCIIICMIFGLGILGFLLKLYRNRNNWTVDNYNKTIGYDPSNYEIASNSDQTRKTRREYYTDDTNAEKLYVRGTLVDRKGKPLATLTENGIKFSEDEATRKAMVKIVGDRYRNISTGTLTAFSGYFSRYVTENKKYTAENSGNQVAITIDSEINKQAIAALGKYTGLIAIYNYRTGQLLCNASTPVYDPDNIPEDINKNPIYSGCYMNSLYQSLFTPGSTMKTVTLEAAIDTIPDVFERRFLCQGSMVINKQVLRCTGVHGNQDLATAYANSCNCAFAEISSLIKRSMMQNNVNNGILTSSTLIDGSIKTAKGSFDIMKSTDFEFAWTCIGLHHDLMNPCSMLMYVGSIANGGQAAIPTNLLSVTDTEGNVIKTTETVMNKQVINPATANKMKEIMVNNTVNHPSHYATGRFNVRIGAKTGTVNRADTGYNGWFVGFVDEPEYPFAFVCFVERAGYGVAIPGGICATMLKALCVPEYAMPVEEPGVTPSVTQAP